MGAALVARTVAHYLGQAAVRAVLRSFVTGVLTEHQAATVRENSLELDQLGARVALLEARLTELRQLWQLDTQAKGET